MLVSDNFWAIPPQDIKIILLALLIFVVGRGVYLIHKRSHR